MTTRIPETIVMKEIGDFKPYKEEEKYKVLLSKDETLLIQKMRDLGYGSMTIHLVAGKIVRTQTTISELTKDAKKGTVTIALEVIEQ